jgi:hypothetical protein
VPDAIIESAYTGRRLIAVVGSSDLPATNDVVLALGQELAAEGLSTLIVEGDMSNPVLAGRLSIRSKAGLTDVLSGGQPLEKTLRASSTDGLILLPAGRQVDRPAALVADDNVQRTLSVSATDVVLVTLPPSMSTVDRDAIASQLHGVVLMVRDGHLRDRQVSSALQDLGALNNILIAVGLVDIVPTPELSYRPNSRRPASKAPAPVAAPVEDDYESEPERQPDVEADLEPDLVEPDPVEPDALDLASFDEELSANGHYEHAEGTSTDESLPHY